MSHKYICINSLIRIAKIAISSQPSRATYHTSPTLTAKKKVSVVSALRDICEMMDEILAYKVLSSSTINLQIASSTDSHYETHYRTVGYLLIRKYPTRPKHTPRPYPPQPQLKKHGVNFHLLILRGVDFSTYSDPPLTLLKTYLKTYGCYV